MLSAALVRCDSDRDEFVDWMRARGTSVAEIISSCDVKSRWLEMLREIQRWQQRDVEDASPLARPRTDVTIEAIVAQRRVIRLLLPDAADHARVFCAALATLIALDHDDAMELLVAIEAAFVPVDSARSAAS